MAENEFQYDPEEKNENVSKYRLPFALCKKYGITVQDWWTPRDAWNALNNGGHIEDVSEEYANYYREKKKLAAKAKREERKHREKAKNAQLSDDAHNPDPNYVHKDGFIAGVSRGKTMTFEQADSGRVNPYIKQAYNNFTGNELIGYRTNCQTCVGTFFARLDGYDVRALPNLNHKAIRDLSIDTMLLYKDKVTGEHPKLKRKPIGQKVIKFLENNISENGRHTVEFSWKGRNDGHIIVARKVGGSIELYDPQIDKITKGADVRRYFLRTKDIKVSDLTNCEIDEAYADKIMKGVKIKDE